MMCPGACAGPSKFHVSKYSLFDIVVVSCLCFHGCGRVAWHDAICLCAFVAAHAGGPVVDLHLGRRNEHAQCLWLFGWRSFNAMGTSSSGRCRRLDLGRTRGDALYGINGLHHGHFALVAAAVFSGSCKRHGLCLGGLVGREAGRAAASAIGFVVGHLLWRHWMGHCLVCAGRSDIFDFGTSRGVAPSLVVGVVVTGDALFDVVVDACGHSQNAKTLDA